jgi:hypothetical protein|tara:strand:+ start:6975 stop:7202 length:228 start_codon:yes stop_codon:yes gene_type:complete
MSSINDFIEEVLSSGKTKKEKYNILLEYDSKMYCYLGIDSTKKEKQLVKTNSRAIYRAVSKIDPVLGKSLLGQSD